MHISRRRFLAATALGLGGVPRFLVRAAEQVEKSPDENILVVLQLSGGNDGLNTVVPFQDPVYHESRPTLAVPRGAALQLRTGGDTEATGAGAPSSADLGFLFSIVSNSAEALSSSPACWNASPRAIRASSSHGFSLQACANSVLAGSN